MFSNFSVIVATFGIIVQAACSSYVDISLDSHKKRYEERKNECSEKCQKEMDASWNNLDLILRMIDSATKIPEGVFNGRFYHLGDYDECVNTVSKDETIYGKYCIGTIPPSIFQNSHLEEAASKQLRMLGLDTSRIGLHTAVCYPSGCTAEDITKLSLLSNFTSKFCYSKNNQQDLSPGAITTITVIAIFLTLVAVSTIFDSYLYYKQKQAPHQISIAFSAISNGRTLFASSSNKAEILCLNGIKAITMMWVVIGHSYINLTIMGPIANYFDSVEWKSKLSSMHLVGASVAVDTFFLVGGLVMVYTYLRGVDRGAKFNILKHYLHRYLRLTPALLITVFFHAYLIRYMGEGPLWAAADEFLGEKCRSNWWPALLYIQNYVNGMNDICVPQAWYLSVDMQLFLLSAPILITLSKWTKQTLWGLGLLSVVGVIIPFVIGWHYELPAELIQAVSDDFNNKYYIQTYARFGPYTIGMLFGYLVYKLKKDQTALRLKPVSVTCLWLVTLSGLLACIYSGHVFFDQDYDRWGNSIFLAFHRCAWATAVGLLVVGCVSGYGGPINSFLSLPVFQFLSKLSYSMYLVHFGVIIVVYVSQKTLIRFSDYQIMLSFWGMFVLTLAVSLLLCLTFELPIAIIDKLVLGRGSKGSRPTKVKALSA